PRRRRTGPRGKCDDDRRTRCPLRCATLTPLQKGAVPSIVTSCSLRRHAVSAEERMMGQRSATDRGGEVSERGEGRADDAPAVLLLTRSDIRCLLDLATDVEFSEAAVSALYEAVRGDLRGAQELLRRQRAAGRAGSSAAAHLFRRDGDYWTIRYEGRVQRLRDTKGLRYLARLLHQPGEAVPVAELTRATRAAAHCAHVARGR